jgi:hypothetical protein
LSGNWKGLISESLCRTFSPEDRNILAHHILALLLVFRADSEEGSKNMMGKNIYEIMLAEQFVPATDEVWRAWNGPDAECVFFHAMGDHGHYGFWMPDLSTSAS